jgi:two-component system OmpR family response regulator
MSGTETARDRLVLLAEDDDNVARVFTRALEQKGMTVRRARAGNEAVAMAQSGSAFQAAVVDLVLPGVGGLDVIRAIRAAQPACRIVAVTGLADSTVERALREAGADAFLGKPVELQELTRALATGE